MVCRGVRSSSTAHTARSFFLNHRCGSATDALAMRFGDNPRGGFVLMLRDTRATSGRLSIRFSVRRRSRTFRHKSTGTPAPLRISREASFSIAKSGGRWVFASDRVAAADQAQAAPGSGSGWVPKRRTDGSSITELRRIGPHLGHGFPPSVDESIAGTNSISGSLSVESASIFADAAADS